MNAAARTFVTGRHGPAKVWAVTFFTSAETGSRRRQRCTPMPGKECTWT